MRIEYECEECGKKFATEKEAIECEEKHKGDKERESMKKKSEEEINKLVSDHIEKYGSIPNIKIDRKFMNNAISEIIESIFSWF